MDIFGQIKRGAGLGLAEDDAIAAAQAGNRAARDRVSTAYLGLVWSIASELVEAGQMEDALAEGSIGLLEALDAFDAARNRPFAAFAGTYIRCRIQDWSRDERGIRRVGNSRVGKRYEPIPEHTSLDEPIPDSVDATGHDVIADEVALSPESECIRRDLARRALVAVNVAELTPSERLVIRRHVLGEETLEAIALDCSRQAMQQTKARALAKLRAALAA